MVIQLPRHGDLRYLTMRTLRCYAGAVLVLSSLPVPIVHAQEQDRTPILSSEVSRTITTVNYAPRTSTRIDFAGTALEPSAKGNARVQSREGSTLIRAEFERLPPATQFGSEYLTYVLWAVSSEGRPINLGQLIVKNGKAKLEVTTQLQTLGLMVTAEPYYAITYPSEAVVLQNVPRQDTRGEAGETETKYELFHRGQYQTSNLEPFLLDPTIPMDMYEARNAMRIGKQEGADRYAPDAWVKAEAALTRAEDALGRSEWNAIPPAAREATQTFEDARLITIWRKEEERLAAERRAAAERETQAKNQAEAAERRRQSEEEARGQVERQRQKAEAARDEALAKAAEFTRQALETAESAERERQQLRATLLHLFNRVLPTRDTDRGLVVNIGDVLYDVGKANLRPGAREALARLSGILLNYPSLRIEIEGHTDSTGSSDLNQILSEQRALSARGFLVENGVAHDSTSVRGYGEGAPIADNATAQGRQMNRRVEIIVSGEVIGTNIGGN